jgi:drug/metabolite transporter (DMT)-like permease
MSAIDAASRQRTWAGVAIALAAAAAFALANTSANVAYHGGSNPLTVAGTRFLLPTAVLIVWLRMSGTPLALPVRDAVIAVVLGIITAFYTWAFLRSFNSIPFALAVLIFYLFPLMAALIVVGLGWQKLRWRTVAAIVVALFGLALALDLRGGHLQTEGVVLAFVSAAGLAVVVAVSSRMFGKGDARPLTLYMAAAAAIALLVVCVASGAFAWPHTSSGWIGFVIAGVLYAFAMIAFFIAISMIGPVRASLLSYADAVISAIIGVVVLGQALTLLQAAGIALVILALIWATLQR